MKEIIIFVAAILIVFLIIKIKKSRNKSNKGCNLKIKAEKLKK